MRALVLAALALSAGGCGSDAPREDAAVRAIERGTAEVGGQVISTVDGAPITTGEVAEVARETGLSPLEALRRLQEERVLAAHAEAAGSGDDFEVRDAVRRASVQALLEARVEAEVRPETIPRADVDARIERERARFARPERRRTTHVLARLAPNAPPEAEAAAERFVRHAIERLRSASDPVAAAREMRSEDREGRTFRVAAEDLPPFPRDGRLVPEYLDAVFGARGTGVIDHPVRTRFGFHAIVVSEILPPWEAPPDEVEAAVRDELVVEQRAARLDALTRELAARTPVTRDEAVIQRALASDLATPSDPAAEGGAPGTAVPGDAEAP